MHGKQTGKRARQHVRKRTGERAGKRQRRIVTLGVEDYDQLVELWKAAGLSSLRLKGRDSRASFVQQLKHGQVVLGLRINGKLIASVVVTDDGRKGWINRLVVHPAWRRKGYGKLLIGEGEKILRRKSIPMFAALIEKDNRPSLLLFEECGYLLHKGIYYLTKRDSIDV